MASCCNNVYYCVAGNIVSQPPGSAPAGFTGGPWATLAEAQVGCTFVIDCGCVPPSITQGKASYHLSFVNKTGAAAVFPNSLELVYTRDVIAGKEYVSTTPGPGSFNSCAWFIWIGCGNFTIGPGTGSGVGIILFTQCTNSNFTNGSANAPWVVGSNLSRYCPQAFYPCPTWDNLSSPFFIGTVSTTVSLTFYGVTGTFDLWISK